ncbi:YiiX/YebB-like N1pC/P60 family cysteine hydrolase [Phenylobacterium sp.]|uniref:YiiX/YebB-like N1pC/P60 family cysteine hydrolase n=1 Tax=Phenylobacterium sp. TaxID=1871053 RepID=UPI00286C3943|nr:YiiX/YebB-like N1pC/P60 family cysteine hydrolase [Phenylobacterium sp.]
MTIDPAVLITLRPQPYAAIRAAVRDGDILLCSATDMFSRLIRWATKSPWSHVAIAFRMDDIDRVMVLECVEKLGVRAVPLSSFIARTSNGTEPYPGKILLARHRGMGAKARRKPMKKMAGFAFDRLGDRFSHVETLRIALRIVLGRFRKRLHPSLGPRNEFICSEYLARCFEAVGVKIPWDGLGFIAPADFASDPRVDAVAQIQT